MRHYRSKFFVALVILLITMALVVPIQAQSNDPSISVTDQVTSGTVWVAKVFSVGPGYIVINNDSGRGSPGQPMGHTLVSPGWNYNVPIDINAGLATNTLWAILHVDDTTIGTYDFGTLGGADAPVKVGDQVVEKSFVAPLIQMDDQFVADDGSVTANSVTSADAGWLVIHADNNGAPGPVLGETLLKPGRNSNVSITLAADGRTPVLWPMLHVDTGVAGTYEFGTVKGADSPVIANGKVADIAIWTEPHVRMADQIAIPGDANKQPDAAPATVTVKSVLSKGPGWLVIHQDGGGKPGGVAGYAAVTDGLNTDVAVTLDKGDVTPVLWPMLHVDDGVAGTYEFGTVAGADAPVKDSTGNVVTFPINAAPTLVMKPQTLVDGSLTIDEALIDAPGWVAIHADNGGKPGDVIANYPLLAGVNSNILIKVDEAKAGTQVFPMLHYDTGVAGTYEFGTVADTDNPVIVNKNVVVAPLSLTGAAPEATTQAAASTCSITPAGTSSVNKRDSASTNGAVVGALNAGESADVVGQAKSASGAVWWTLADGSWVRSDVVKESGDCSGVPTVAGGSAAEATPATTPEPGS